MEVGWVPLCPVLIAVVEQGLSRGGFVPSMGCRGAGPGMVVAVAPGGVLAYGVVAVGFVEADPGCSEWPCWVCFAVAYDGIFSIYAAKNRDVNDVRVSCVVNVSHVFGSVRRWLIISNLCVFVR